jgi:hypothetical protein
LTVFLGLTGCDSTDVIEKEYLSPDYGFSIEYSPLLSEAPEAAASAPSLNADFVVGFLDEDHPPQASGGSTGLFVVISTDEVDIPTAQAYALTRKGWFLMGDKRANKLGDYRLEAKRTIERDGVSFWLYEGEGTLGGQRFHFRSEAVLVGTSLYQLLGQWPTSAAETTGRAVSKAMDSFRLSTDTRAAALAAAPAEQHQQSKARRHVNKRYRFALAVPASFLEFDTGQLPTGSRAAFSLGFADASTDADTLDGANDLMTAFYVQVGPLEKELSPSQASQLVRAMSKDARTYIREGFEAMYEDLVMGEIRLTRLAECPALAFELTYQSRQGTKQRQRVYVLVAGRYLYQLQLEASQPNWKADVGTLEKMARSFRVL